MNWQPIETAPKDGTDILVYYEFATVPIVHIAYYSEYKDEQYPDGTWHYPFEDTWKDQGFNSKEDAEGWWSYVKNSVSQHKLDGPNTPTHWMPLERPEKPAGEFK